MRFLCMIPMVAWLIGFAALAQDAPPPAPSLTVRSTLVEVPVLVQTKSGETVFALEANDFLLSDNGAPQQVTVDTESGSQPLALAIVVETGGAGTRHLRDYGKLDPAFERLTANIEHRVAVISFDSAPQLLLPFTPQTSRAAFQLANLEPGDNDAAILDAIAFAIEKLRQQPERFRRAILLLGETVDLSSTTSLGDTLKLIGSTNTAVFSFGFSSTRSAVMHENSKFNRPNEPGPDHGCFSREGADAEYSGHYGRQVLDCISDLAPPLRIGTMAYLAAHEGLRRNTSQSIAQLTGGMFHHFENAHDLEAGLNLLAREEPNYYILSFRPSALTPGPHALHLEMKDRPKLSVNYRTEYWLDSKPAN